MENERNIPHEHGSGLAEVLPNMPDTEHFAEAAALFQQLCDGSRLKSSGFFVTVRSAASILPPPSA